MQANGAMYSTGVLHLSGARPNTTYTVQRKLHATGLGCTAFFANFTISTTVMTNEAGNATENLQTLRSTVDQFPFLHGRVVGQIIEVYAPGTSLAYATTCTTYTMH